MCTFANVFHEQMTSVGDDCYYFYYSSCMKAAACAFRHSAPALGKEEVCPDWMKGSCRVLNCPLRHMIIQVGFLPVHMPVSGHVLCSSVHHHLY